MPKHFFITLLLGLGSCAMGGCAALAAPKVPEIVWTRLAAGQVQDLIVEFESLAIKQAALAALPDGAIEMLKDYPDLPMMFVRLRSAAALKALLANPAIVNVYQNQQESLVPAK